MFLKNSPLYYLLLRNKNSEWHLLKHGKEDLFKVVGMMGIVAGNTAKKFCSVRERPGSTLRTGRASVNL